MRQTISCILGITIGIILLVVDNRARRKRYEHCWHSNVGLCANCARKLGLIL